MARNKGQKVAAPQNAQASQTPQEPLKPSTVMVALNRASGLIFAMPDGRKVHINGSAADLRGKGTGVLPVGAYGLTEVNADDWDWIERTYSGMELFKNGLLFAQKNRARAEDASQERNELRHGLEPVSVDKGMTRPFDGQGA